MAVSFDLAVELTFPIGESFSSGITMSGGQVGGIIFTLVTSSWLQDSGVTRADDTSGSDYSFLLLLLATIIAFVSTIFIKQNLKRIENEKKLK